MSRAKPQRAQSLGRDSYPAGNVERVMMEKRAAYCAPWGLSLKLVTLFATGILVGIPILGVLNNHDHNIVLHIFMVVIPLLILFGAMFFMVRGYELGENTLFVRRLGWKTKIALTDLENATVDPEAVKGSIRIFGNGGLFSTTGLFRNKKLGTYRAYVTDSVLAVVLKFPDRTLVVSPDDPTGLAEQLSK